MSNLIVVGYTEVLSSFIQQKIKEITQIAINGGISVQCFYQDSYIVELLKEVNGVQIINALESSADMLIFNKIHSNYSTLDKLNEYKPKNVESIYKKAKTRFPVAKKTTAFDELEMKTRREATLFSRIRFFINSYTNNANYILYTTGKKEVQLLMPIKAVQGDGKFIYEINTQTERISCFIGGFPIKETDYLECLKKGV